MPSSFGATGMSRAPIRAQSPTAARARPGWDFSRLVHVALPSSRVLAFRSAAQKIAERHGVRLQESGLWVQPELFSMRLGAEDGSVANAQLALEEAIEELLRSVQQMGGSMEYTHGVGVKLAPMMAEEHGYGLQVMRQIKQALDPNNI